MKHTSELKTNRKARLEQAKLLHSQAQPTRMEFEPSRLEQLPVELLELIFFFCLEINLPLASRTIGDKLKRPELFRTLTLYAFFEPVCHPEVQTRRIHPCLSERLEVHERISLQNSILSCKWCTLDLLQSCASELAELQMSQWLQVERNTIQVRLDHGGSYWEWVRSKNAKILESYQAEDGPESDMPEPEAIPNDSIKDAASFLPSVTDKDAIRRHFKVDGEASNLPYVTTHDFNDYIWTEGYFRPIRRGRCIFAARAVPQCALRGKPWTSAKIELLKLLRQGIRYLYGPPQIAISTDALFEGFRNAIIESNRAALLVLLELYLTCVKWGNESKRPYGAESIKSSHYAPVVYIPVDLFHLAYTHAATDVSSRDDRFQLLRLLFRGGIENIPPNDEILTHWATHVQADQSFGGQSEDARAATWLLQHMEHSMTFEACFGAEESNPYDPVLDLADAIGYTRKYTYDRTYDSYG
jgi:hypothetical protein